MKHWVLALGLALASVMPAGAQQIIGEYYALLGPQDMRNSRGQRLGNFCAVVQQDRANFHRFGRGDDLDSWDPVFADKAMRARIAGNCRVQSGYEYIPRAVMSGETRYIWVRILGRGGVPTQLLITEGAG